MSSIFDDGCHVGQRPRPASPRLWVLAAVLLTGAIWLGGCAAGGALPGTLPAAGQGASTPSIVAASPTARVQPGPVSSPTPATAQAQAAPPAAAVLASAEEVQRIAPAEARALLDKGAAVLYDVRGADAYQTKHAKGALSLPLDQIESLAGTLPKGKPLILYCT